MRNLSRTLIAAAAMAAPLAQAQAWYAGFAAGRGSLDSYPLPVTGTSVAGDGVLTSFSFSPLEGDQTMVMARLGARLDRHLAVEAGYFRFGEFVFQTATSSATSSAIVAVPARARSAGLSVVGILPLAPVDLYARAGFARTEIKAQERHNDTDIEARARFNEAFYGAGVRWNATPQLGLFAEYQRHDKLGLDGYFAGFDWRF